MKITIPISGNPVPHQQGIQVKMNKWGKPTTYKNERLASFQDDSITNPEIK